MADDDLLREQHDVDRVLEGVHVEGAVVARNFIRLSDARLHAESSIDTYSEQVGSRIGPVLGLVCHG